MFLDTLAEAHAKTGWRIHASVLMGNHYHLLPETPGGNLAELPKGVPEQVVLAGWLRERTTVSLRWVAERQGPIYGHDRQNSPGSGSPRARLNRPAPPPEVPAGRPIIAHFFKGGFAVHKNPSSPVGTAELLKRRKRRVEEARVQITTADELAKRRKGDPERAGLVRRLPAETTRAWR